MQNTRKQFEDWYKPLDGILDKPTAWYAWKESRDIALEEAATIADTFDCKPVGLSDALRRMKAPHH